MGHWPDPDLMSRLFAFADLLSGVCRFWEPFGFLCYSVPRSKDAPVVLFHGSYNFKQTKFKDFSRTFEGQKLVFKDSVSFTKPTFLVPLLTLKTLNSVITYLRYVHSPAIVDDVSL